MSGDTEKLSEELDNILKQCVSYFDTANESFYCGLVLGCVL